MADLDPTLLKYRPGAYVSGYNNAIPQQFADQLNVLGNIMDIHHNLLKTPNDKAYAEYQKLHPDVQEALKFNFPDSGEYYLTKPGNWWVNSIEKIQPQKAFQSTFNFAFGALDKYTKALNTPYNVMQAEMQRPANMPINTWQAGWDGVNIFDRQLKENLDSFYGKAMSDLVTGVIAGKMPGEIVYERAATRPEEINSQEFQNALNIYFNRPDMFKEILEDYRRAQMSPGRAIARDLLGPTSIGPSGAVADALFTVTSGIVDAAYQIAIDPLTWATFGVGTAITKGARLASLIQKEKATGVAKIFDKTPAVVKYWDDLGEVLNELGTARKAKNIDAAARARDRIRIEFRDYDDDAIINRLIDGKIVDGQSAKEFFVKNENWHFMLHGRTQSVSFFREKVAYSSRLRKFSIGSRNKINSYFNGREALPEVSMGSWLDELYKVADEGADDLAKNRNLPVLEQIVADNMTVKRQLALLMRNHPGTQAIVWGENYAETLPALRALVDITVGGDKQLADRFAEIFSMVGTGDRKRMLQGVYTSLMYKLGLHRTEDGLQLMREMLERSFGDSMAVTKDVAITPLDKTVVPQLVRNEIGQGNKAKVNGSIHAAQEATAVASFPFVKVLEKSPFGYSYSSANKKSPVRHLAWALGGMTNHVASQRVMNTWAALTLLPTLGIRSAIDEGFFGLLTLPGDVMYQVFGPRTTAKKLANVRAAISANAENIGPIKSGILSLINKNPASALNDLRPYADRDEIINTALNRFGNLPPEAARHFRFAVIADQPLSAGLSSANSQVARSARTTTIDGTATGDILLPVEKQRLFDDIGKAEETPLMVGPFITMNAKSYRNLGDSTQTLIMKENAEFIINNPENVRKIKTQRAEYTHDPASVFFNRNGLKTEQDWINAQDDLLATVGISSEPVQTSMIRSLSLGPNARIYKVVDQEALDKYLKNSGEAAFQRAKDANVSDIDIARELVFYELQDIRNAFHGSPNMYNDALMDTVRGIAKSDDISMKLAFKKIPFDEFQEITNGFRYVDVEDIRTRVYPEVFDADPKSWLARFGMKVWDAMDRQLTDLFRGDATMAFYLKYMEMYDESITIMKNDLLRLAKEKDEFLSPEVAEDLAGIYFSNIAAKNAANRVLSYVDNPNVRSNFAYSLRTAGRFYRATEDFMRRLYRLGANYPIKAALSMRLMSLGLESMGMVHRDQEGRPYVLLPFDNVIFEAVNTPIRLIMGDKYAIKIPRFVQFPLKLQFLNPSFQEGAGMPTLSGPIAGLGVKAAQGMLGMVLGPEGDKIVGKIDDYILGDVAGQPEWWRLIVPSKAVRFFEAVVPYAQIGAGDMSAEDQLFLEDANLVYAATSYMFAHPDKNPVVQKMMNGEASEKDYEDFLDSLRIAAHNVKFIKNFFGFFFAPVGSQESVDLHTYQLRNGVVSPRQEFIEIVQNLSNLPRDQRPAELIETAIATFVGENPNRLVYTVSRNKKTDVAIANTNKAKDWIMESKDIISDYGSSAFIFMPQSGEFDKVSYQYLQAEGLINSRDFKEFLHDVETKRLRQNIFDSEAQLEANLLETANPNDRKIMIEKHQDFADFIKASHPRVKAAMEQNLGQTDEEIMLKSLKELLQDPRLKATEQQKNNMWLAINMVENGLAYFSDFTYGGDQDRTRLIKNGYKDRILAELENLGSADPQIRVASDSIFKPLINIAVRNTPGHSLRGS